MDVNYYSEIPHPVGLSQEPYSALHFASGNNKLCLSGVNSINVYQPSDYTFSKQGAAIGVPVGVTLEISEIENGTGSLTVSGGPGGSGIGGGSGWGIDKIELGEPEITNGGDAGTIIIKSGTINAIGGIYASGIGGGWGGNGGNIIIEGGTVAAMGGERGSGIGGGNAGNVGTITISGGNVTAKGQKGGAGIGGGTCYNSTECNYDGTITLSGGVVLSQISTDDAGSGVNGFGAPFYWGKGATVGSGGVWSEIDPRDSIYTDHLYGGSGIQGEAMDGESYILQNITYFDEATELTLTYSVNSEKSDAVLPTIERLNLDFNAGFQPFSSLRWEDSDGKSYKPGAIVTKVDESGINMVSTSGSENTIWIVAVVGILSAIVLAGATYWYYSKNKNKQ
ncbi:hypothetical protein [Methanolapillus millepedarum]